MQTMTNRQLESLADSITDNEEVIIHSADLKRLVQERIILSNFCSEMTCPQSQVGILSRNILQGG